MDWIRQKLLDWTGSKFTKLDQRGPNAELWLVNITQKISNNYNNNKVMMESKTVTYDK